MTSPDAGQAAAQQRRLLRTAAVGAVLVTGTALLAACGDDDGGGAGDTQLVIREVRTSYSWVGLAGRRSYSYSIVCGQDGGRCQATVECVGMHFRGPGEPSTSQTTVPPQLVEALDSILAGAEPATGPSETIEHTDDYPKYDITLGTDTGDLTVSSTSNTSGNIPWNLQRDGRRYVNDGTAFPAALTALNDAVLPEGCLN